MYTIVADSCCDMTPELREQLGVVSVPLTMTLGEDSYVDDETLDLPAFMAEMKQCTGRIGSAAPAPQLYRDAFCQNAPCFGITLSGQLSGSHQSALVGRDMAAEEGTEVYVFDSKSASAGEVLLAVHLRELIDKGHPSLAIIAKMERFIKEMKTYFVLDSIENLQKNGRLNALVGKVISILGIKPVLGSDGNGNIALFSHARGQDQVVQRLAETVAKSKKETRGQDLVITHCNNPGLAARLKDAIERAYHFRKVWVVPTGGLSSVYADNKGVVIAF